MRRFVATTSTVAALLLVPGLARANPELERVRSDIRALGLGWTAAETGISRLPRGLRPRLQGAGDLASPPGAATLPGPLPASLDRLSAGELPAAFDWRNHKGRNWMTPVRYQGACGACWAFASIGAFEGLVAWRFSMPDPLLDLSEQQLLDCSNSAYSCDSGAENWSISAFGLEFGPGVYMREHGVTTESCYSYSASRGFCGTLSPGCAAAALRVDDFTNIYETVTTRISGAFDWVMPPETALLLKTLVMERPVGVSMDVYSDFDFYKGGVYEPSPSATFSGLHAVLLIGWDDAQQCWIARNSWDTWWGEGGYFRVKYGASSLGARAFTYSFLESEKDPAFCTSGPSALPAGITLDAKTGFAALRVANCGGGVLEWTATASAGWLAWTNATGAPIAQASDVARGGVYHVVLTGPPVAGASVTLSGAPNGPVTIPVTVLGTYDAGLPPPDAGLPVDGGVVAPDAGDANDAGRPTLDDAGTRLDAGTDAGTLDPTASAPDDVGCGCAASGAAPAGIAWLAALALARKRR